MLGGSDGGNIIVRSHARQDACVHTHAHTSAHTSMSIPGAITCRVTCAWRTHRSSHANAIHAHTPPLARSKKSSSAKQIDAGRSKSTSARGRRQLSQPPTLALSMPRLRRLSARLLIRPVAMAGKERVRLAGALARKVASWAGLAVKVEQVAGEGVREASAADGRKRLTCCAMTAVLTRAVACYGGIRLLLQRRAALRRFGLHPIRV
jgi:hypothetical protein